MTHPGNPVEIGTPSASSAKLTLPQRCRCRLILALFGRLITVENPENLSNLPEPALFVFNHNIAFETLLVLTYLYSLPLWPLQSLKL